MSSRHLLEAQLRGHLWGAREHRRLQQAERFRAFLQPYQQSQAQS